MKKPEILLPLQGSESELKVISPARGLAKLLNGYVHILHITNEYLSREDLFQKLNLDPHEFPEFVLNCKNGDPASIILEHAKSSDYLILSTDTLSPLIIDIIQHSDIPVILLRPDSELNNDFAWKPERVLFPLDGSMESAQCVEACLDIIKKSDPEIDILHIFTLPEIRQYGTKFSAPYYQDHPHHDWNAWKKEFIMRFFPHPIKHHKITLSLSKGDPAEAIVEFTKKNKVDMIVLAWQGIFIEDHALILKEILHSVKCPIFLIKIKKNEPIHYTR